MSRFSTKSKALVALMTCVAASAYAVLTADVTVASASQGAVKDNNTQYQTPAISSSYWPYVDFTVTLDNPPLNGQLDGLTLDLSNGNDKLAFLETMADADGVITITPDMEVHDFGGGTAGLRLHPTPYSAGYIDLVIKGETLPSINIINN